MPVPGVTDIAEDLTDPQDWEDPEEGGEEDASESLPTEESGEMLTSIEVPTPKSREEEEDPKNQEVDLPPVRETVNTIAAGEEETSSGPVAIETTDTVSEHADKEEEELIRGIISAHDGPEQS